MSAVTGLSPLIEVLSDGARRWGQPEFDRLAAELARPLRIGVRGRPGAGRTTLRRALRCAGADPEAIEVEVYVFVETLTPEDRAALGSRSERPRVAVLNKADLLGFGGPGPMAAAAARCHALQPTVGVPVLPLAGLLAAAGNGIEPAVLDGLVAVARGRGDPDPHSRLLAELDLFGVATAVAALRDGAGRGEVAAVLRRASGLDALIAEIDRAGAAVRYRRAAAGLGRLAGLATGSRAVADFLAGDDVVLARSAAAAAVLEAAGLPTPMSRDSVGLLRDAIAWRRYGDGPVSALHRACAADLSRAALRRWSRAA